MNLKHVIRTFVLFTLIEIAVIGAAFGLFAALGAATADAHTPSASIVCDRVWQEAPPGHRWAAKQRCIAAIRRHVCVTHVRPVPRTVTVKGVRVDSGQRHVLGWLAQEAKRRNLPRTVFIASVAATTQEASARELPYGEGTSVGPFQLTSYHGTRAQRITVEHSGNWFFNGAMKVWSGNRGIDPATLAQAVERSGYPAAYSQWVPEARRTTAVLVGRCLLR